MLFQPWPYLDVGGFCGVVNSGTVRRGDVVRVLPSGKTSGGSGILILDGDVDQGVAGQSGTICLADEIDCSRGDVITIADSPLEVADQFETTIVWMADEPMLPGRPYWLKTATTTVSATVTDEKYQVNVNTMEHIAGKTLDLRSEEHTSELQSLMRNSYAV